MKYLILIPAAGSSELNILPCFPQSSSVNYSKNKSQFNWTDNSMKYELFKLLLGFFMLDMLINPLIPDILTNHHRMALIRCYHPNFAFMTLPPP